MRFEAPVLLLCLLAVPAAIAAYVWFDRRHDMRAASWAAPALLPNMIERPPAWRRHLPTALLLAGVALLLVGFARPSATFNVKREEATIVLVLDVSGSMAANDTHPTRLGASRAAAERFIDGLPHGYEMAVVVFSDHASVVAPPTRDTTRLRYVIEHARSGPQGTALAAAVSRAVDVAISVHSSTHGVRVPGQIVLFSDGGQTAGRTTPQQAGAQAAKAHVPVTAVAVGTPDGVVQQPLKGGFTERFQVPVKPAALQTIARASGGRFVTGPQSVDVHATYASLKERAGQKRKSVEVTSAAAGGGLAFMLAGALLSGLWFRRLT
jgi:Ca-activated chloride channel family protein